MDENHTSNNQAGHGPGEFEGGTEAGGVGLDIGTSRIVIAGGPNGHQAHSQLNAFVELPWSKMTEASLRQKKVLF